MRPKKRQGLTVPEVMKILGRARPTVISLFEQGILIGYKHPVRHWRIIDRESVEALKRKWAVTPRLWRV